jgi:hypothetical protein
MYIGNASSHRNLIFKQSHTIYLNPQLSTTMGNTQSTVRYLAPASFAYDFIAQQYGIFSSPNMLDIHNKNLAAFSPYPYFIGAFFFPQQIFQLVWLWKLWKQDGNKQECAMMNKFAWVYSLGNVCIGSMYSTS